MSTSDLDRALHASAGALNAVGAPLISTLAEIFRVLYGFLECPLYLRVRHASRCINSSFFFRCLVPIQVARRCACTVLVGKVLKREAAKEAEFRAARQKHEEEAGVVSADRAFEF